VRNAGCRTVLVGVGLHDVDEAGPALVAGAAGVVARPYDAAELTSRLEPEVHDFEQRFRLVYGPLELDPWAYRVRAGGRVMENLPLKEFELLRLLMAHADHVVSPAQVREASVVCTHRPVLPWVFEGLGLEPHQLAPGSVFVVHHRKGRILATEHHNVSFR